MKQISTCLAITVASLNICSNTALAQSSTINTELMASSGYSSATSAGSGGTKYITFAVENNSGGDIKITEIGRYVTTGHNGETSTVYYSESSLSGNPGSLPATGWVKDDEEVIAGVTSSAINPVNTGMELIIPSGKTYRIAMLTTGTNYYSSSGSPNNFTVAGVSLYAGDYQLNGGNVGYGASNTPRYFRGYITFEPACDAKISAPPTTKSVCPGDTVSYSATATGAQAYRWQSNSNGTWTNLTDNFTYTGTATNTLTIHGVTAAMAGNDFRVIATNTPSNCSVISDSASLDLLGAGYSSVGINASTGLSICKNQEVSVHSFFTNGGTNPRFEWYKNGIIIPGETSGVLKINTIADNDVITCKFYSNAQCVGTATSNVLKFDVETRLIPTVSVNSIYNGGNSFTFTAVPQHGGDNPTYYWFVNGKAVPEENGQTFTKEDMKSYDVVTVMMRSDLPCADPQVVSSRGITTSVASINDEQLFTLSPNPTSGQFVISLNNAVANEEINVRIFNGMGQLVYSQSATADGSARIQVTMPANSPAGVYIANISSGAEQASLRFVLR